MNVNFRTGMSGSVPPSVIFFAALCATATVCALAVGVPAAMLRVTVAGLLVLTPLLTVNVKLSLPWYAAVGV